MPAAGRLLPELHRARRGRGGRRQQRRRAAVELEGLGSYAAAGELDPTPLRALPRSNRAQGSVNQRVEVNAGRCRVDGEWGELRFELPAGASFNPSSSRPCSAPQPAPGAGRRELRTAARSRPPLAPRRLPEPAAASCGVERQGPARSTRSALHRPPLVLRPPHSGRAQIRLWRQRRGGVRAGEGERRAPAWWEEEGRACDELRRGSRGCSGLFAICSSGGEDDAMTEHELCSAQVPSRPPEKRRRSARALKECRPPPAVSAHPRRHG
ncbi:unnamed protein product [Urochloa humidicola]